MYKLVIIYMVLMLGNLQAGDLNSPFKEWSFVAIIEGADDGDISIAVLKDDLKLCSDKSKVIEMHKHFLNSYNKLGKRPTLYAMTFNKGKKFDRTKVIAPKLLEDLKILIEAFCIAPDYYKKMNLRAKQ